MSSSGSGKANGLKDASEYNRTQQPVRLAFGLALLLLAVVVGLNALDSAGKRVEPIVFAGLLDEGAIEAINLHPGQGISAQTSQGRIWVELSPAQEDITHWRSLGLLQEASEPNYSGIFFLGLGLAGGTLYLVLQAKAYRRNGSPRQELKDLEEARERGLIDDEEFRSRSEAAWGKM